MKELNKKIKEECKKAIKLRECASSTDNMEKAIKIREEQQKHYDKFIFLKNLDKALKESKGKL